MRIKDIAAINAKTKTKFDSAIAYYDTASVIEGHILEPQIIDPSTEKIPSRAQRIIKDKTILYSTVRPYLRHFGIIEKPSENAIASTGFVTIDAKEEIVNPFYLYYWLTRDEITSYLNTIAASSVSSYPSINPKDIYDIAIDLPTMDEQERIASILRCIDAKIRVNNKIIKTSEKLMREIYDYWFVQFDFPDENGRPYKSSGGKMKWNEKLKREIPEGWVVKPLEEYITVVRGISYKPADELKEESANSVSLLKSNNIQDGAINYDQPVFLPAELVGSGQWLTKGSVFIAMSSGSKAHMGKTAIVYKDLPYTFGAFCAKINIDTKATVYLSTYFTSEWFRAYIENVTAGTSINNIGNEQLTNIPLPFPDDMLQKRFEEYLEPIFDELGELNEENRRLTSLRDWLLPMLMNGQIKVSD